MKHIRVIGGGLAGPEAALQIASRGNKVSLYEMRPTRSTEAHQTADFAELVCSNSLKSESENSAPWLLKQEMRRAGSFLLADAEATASPSPRASPGASPPTPTSPSSAKRSPRSTQLTRTSPSSPAARSPPRP